MHPEVVSDEPGRCPKCGMKLLAATSVPQPSAVHDHADMDHEAMDHGGGDGIEWEDDMVEVNRLTTTCSTSAIPGCGWPIATSPSTCRAA